MSNFPVESCEEVPDLDWRAEVYANERVIKSQNRHMDIAYNNLARTSMLGVLAVLVLILSYINQSDVLGLLDIIIAVFLISRGIAITTHSFILLGSFSLEFWKSYQNQGFKRTKHTLKMFYDRSARTGPHYLIIAFSIMLSLIVFVIATITGIAWWVTVFRAEVTLWLLLDHIPFLSANHLLAVILLILIVFSIFNPQGLVLGEGHQRRRFEL